MKRGVNVASQRVGILLTGVQYDGGSDGIR